MSQMDIFGVEIPLGELDWPLILQELSRAERDAGARLAADEAGAIVHGHEGRHDADVRCDRCSNVGREALNRLRARLGSEASAQDAGSLLSGTGRHAGASDPSGRREARRGAPRARSTDPATSHAAARSIAPGALRDSQEAVLRLFRELGPMDDTLLVDRYQEAVDEGFRPSQSPSGIRTRRAELETAGRLRDSGRKVRLQSGRQAIVWELVPLDAPRERGQDEPPL